MPVIVIGAGQAGLAVSRELGLRGVDHVVLERSRVGQAWRDRWDSFTLVTPNWTLNLPGSPYDGDDPEGHVPRDEIVAYLERYRDRWAVPVREGVAVDRLSAATDGGFRLATSEGAVDADAVVVCSGAFQRPFRPSGAAFPDGVAVIDALSYRNPDSVAAGPVLVIGCGETGCQIAEELQGSGRDVYLSCGRAPWYPRRLGDADIVTWLYRAGFYEQRLADITPAIRLLANPQFTGAAGGHDLHYRTMLALGVTLLGRFAGMDGTRAHFADDLAASVAFGDARCADAFALLETRLPDAGYDVPTLPAIEPFPDVEPITTLDLSGFGAVIVATGFRPDYGWIDFPVFDEVGYPITVEGAVPDVPGLYFCGVHFMTRRRSGFLYGVGEDAASVAEAISLRSASGAAGERTRP
ncbi:NAD(P)-binding domain-containing protein [Microbacterium sp. ASV49]|uniref:NAD(P)-binding domain-containing protein n=1 Tax=Microbacterium candidum TaxID=3041922 RepID=A0ABT7MVJ8_9MICO|nr:NAD(P)-binding domain-containing protein [Microbacterium sp. ASV49]MDL9978474.1 NAD(P)-binding domain-containing protein [Microbacterium sp. ASV49]